MNLSLQRENKSRIHVTIGLNTELSQIVERNLLAIPCFRFVIEHRDLSGFQEALNCGQSDLYFTELASLKLSEREISLPDRGTLVAIRSIETSENESSNSDAFQEPLPDLLDSRFDCLGQDEISPTTMLRFARYVSSLNDAHKRLEELQKRYDLILSGAFDGLWEWDLVHTQMRSSMRWKSLLDIPEDQFNGVPADWIDRIHPDDLAAFRNNLQSHFDGRTPIHQFEHRCRGSDGSYRWMLSRGQVRRDEWGRPVMIAGSLTDIDARKQVEARLLENHRQDSLTGLASRRALIEKVDEAILHNQQDPHHVFALLFVNINRFKIVNESIGPESGDQVLSEVATRLIRCVGPTDLVCRYGSDEFALLLNTISDFAECQKIADEIHGLLKYPFDLGGNSIYISASIGIVVNHGSYQRAADMIRDAGLATTGAKRSEGNATANFQRSMHQQAVDTLRLQNSLRHAVERHEFEVYYQPIIALGSNTVSGFEALVRWHHPRRGVIGPHEFISLAEETGLIVPIGKFVLWEACRQMALWRKTIPNGSTLTVSVNLSARQIINPQLIQEIERILDETGLQPSGLRIEITESTLIDETELISNRLQNLRERGVRLYIDDFGTGYSSLSYLHRFAIDGLKIDKSFVDMLHLTDGKGAIVPSIIGLARNLNIAVVAEGVEFQRQLVGLQKLECSEAQGFLFSPPIPRYDVGKYLMKRSENLSELNSNSARRSIGPSLRSVPTT